MPEIRPKSRDADEKTPHDEFVLLLDVDIPAGEASAAAAVGDDSPMQFSADRDYKVFSVEHDRVVQAASLVRGALLRELREGLDQRICARGINVSRLACLLLAALGSPQCDGWNDGQEMGHIDGRRLAQLIVSPTERHLFRLPRQKPATDCLVSLLVDCSGSMKVYADELTVMVDLLARAMDMAGVSAEILGFTTNAWHGGRPQKEWVATGRTAKPGRLNELCHIVFKDAETAWRRARRPIAALLKPDLFREGIHGEAVEWACGRIAARDASRRILIVITDGGPNDGATNLANDSLYLDRHLDAVLATHATGRDVEIFALGIGRNLSGIFSRGIQVDLSQTLTNQLFFRIAEMLMPRRR
jgi:cobaltochelatase CobT